MRVERVAGKEGLAVLITMLHEYWETMGTTDALEITRLEARTLLSLTDPDTAWFVAFDDELRGFISVEVLPQFKNGDR